MAPTANDILVAIPVKPFGVAKQRLAPFVDRAGRSRLGRAVAARTLGLAATVSTHPVVVTADQGVARWAADHGAIPLFEPQSGGLNGAAATAVAEAVRLGLPWMIVHADLPLADVEDLEAIIARLLEVEVVLAPSHDGGSNVVAGRTSSFPFAYGLDSFRRHLARVARLRHGIVVRSGLALDLDAPEDLETARRSPRGAWLEEILGRETAATP